jgi:hypothetical protein
MERAKKILKVLKGRPEKPGTKAGVMKSAAQRVEEGIGSLFAEDAEPWKSSNKLRPKSLKDEGRDSLIAAEGVLFVPRTPHPERVYVSIHIFGVQKSKDEEGCPRNVGFHQDDSSFWSQDSIGLKEEKGGSLQMMEHIKQYDVMDTLVLEWEIMGVQNSIQPWCEEDIGANDMR